MNRYSLSLKIVFIVGSILLLLVLIAILAVGNVAAQTTSNQSTIQEAVHDQTNDDLPRTGPPVNVVASPVSESQISELPKTGPALNLWLTSIAVLGIGGYFIRFGKPVTLQDNANSIWELRQLSKD